MRKLKLVMIPLLAVLFLGLGSGPSQAALFVQCPGDWDGDMVPNEFLPDGVTPNPDYNPNVVCMHISGGDGYLKMADGTDLYSFGFGEVPPPKQVPLRRVMNRQSLKARAPAPHIELQEGQELYLTLTNVGMTMRPDLFDTHSVHWHGYPNAAPMFDGLPEPSPTPNMGASFTYYYYAGVPGTYFYHCHVEAAEHMQMGMIGTLHVHPSQNGTSITYGGKTFTKFAYNDGDGSTGYHRDFHLQITAFDSNFHIQHEAVQPLPFADMHDNYPMFNGRGYPDTVNVSNNGVTPDKKILNKNGFWAQRANSLVKATSGQTILLRIGNVSTTHLYTITSTLGVPMKVVGQGAAQRKSPAGVDVTYEANVLNFGGGQAYDVLIDTTGVPAGTYFIYATDLSNLSNGDEERGGLMTEVVIN